MRGSILEDATPTAMKHGTGRGLPLRDALEYVIPELNIHCLRLALNTPKVTEQLLKLDEQGVSRGPGWVGTQGQQPAAPLETAVSATAGEGSKGRLLLENPVPTLTPLHRAS